MKGLLKTHFMLTYREGYYPLFFADQVAFFEARGEPWPWQGKEGPSRVGALIRRLEDRVQVALALTSPREARQLLDPTTTGVGKTPRLPADVTGDRRPS